MPNPSSKSTRPETRHPPEMGFFIVGVLLVYLLWFAPDQCPLRPGERARLSTPETVQQLLPATAPAASSVTR